MISLILNRRRQWLEDSNPFPNTCFVSSEGWAALPAWAVPRFAGMEIVPVRRLKGADIEIAVLPA